MTYQHHMFLFFHIFYLLCFLKGSLSIFNVSFISSIRRKILVSHLDTRVGNKLPTLENSLHSDFFFHTHRHMNNSNDDIHKFVSRSASHTST